MINRFMITSAIAALLATGALAQTTTPAPTSPAPTSAAPTNATTTTAGAGTAGDATMLKPDEMRASKIIGATVYGPDDKSIGDVNDLIVERDGRISSAVLSVGGFLGLGEKHVAVPIAELKHGNNDHLTVNLTKDQLEKAPKFDYADRGRPADAARSGSSTAPASGMAPTTTPGSTSGTTSAPK
jgi:sporulation protein YlmC with PRC-barrel domain